MSFSTLIAVQVVALTFRKVYSRSQKPRNHTEGLGSYQSKEVCVTVFEWSPVGLNVRAGHSSVCSKRPSLRTHLNWLGESPPASKLRGQGPQTEGLESCTGSQSIYFNNRSLLRLGASGPHFVTASVHTANGCRLQKRGHTGEGSNPWILVGLLFSEKIHHFAHFFCCCIKRTFILFLFYALPCTAGKSAPRWLLRCLSSA